MHLYYDNINDAFNGIVKGFSTNVFYSGPDPGPDAPVNYPSIARTTSRNGYVITIEEPVTVTYMHPLRRVLFNRARDANPFFHAVEALWMLAGRNDLEPLKHFNSEMERFSDDGRVLHGAYGKRWRGWFLDLPSEGQGIDQLEDCIKALANRNNRRVVLQMWDAEVDLPRTIEQPNCKDVPCNLCIMFRPRLVHPTGRDREFTASVYYLDMTVINRSNDMMLGALGANYVHFSFLQEYMALATEMQVGHYHQISNNYHQYIDQDDNWLPTKCQSQKLLAQAVTDSHMRYLPGYELDGSHIALYNDREQFDEEVKYFFNTRMWRAESIQDFGDTLQEWRSPFILQVVIPMVLAFNAHKRRDYLSATAHLRNCKAPDWYIASLNWLEKRELNYQKAQNGGVHAV